MSALKITYRSSTFAGKVVSLDQPVVLLGRDPVRCDVLFDESGDRVVSRHHAQLRWEDHTLVMVPMPGKIVLRGGVSLLEPVSVFSGDIFELAGPGGPAIEVSFDYVVPSPPLRTLRASQFKAVAESRQPAAETNGQKPNPPAQRPAHEGQQNTSARTPASVELAVDQPLPALTEARAALRAPERKPAPEPTQAAPAGVSTTFLPVLPKTPVPAFPRTPRTQRILVAGVTAIALVGLVVLTWSMYSKADAKRRATQRVERLKEAFKEMPGDATQSDAEALRKTPSPSR